MKKVFLGIFILFVLLIVAIYSVYTYRSNIIEAQKLNKQYEEYLGKEFLGTELISIINRTIDINHKNEIAKDGKGYYVDNGENSLHIEVKFIYNNDTKLIHMEELEKGGTESFIKMYSTASFKCTKIEYHEKTHHVKTLIFEENMEG